MSAIGEERLRASTKWFAIAVIAGCLLRIILVVTTIGTNDVVFNTMWARLIERHGIAHAYAYNQDLNHPPLSLLIFSLMNRTSRLLHVRYTDVFRMVQSIADVFSLFFIGAIARRLGRPSREMALFFFLSPTAIAISAFHCNTDSTMVALTCLAVLLLIGDRPLWSGVVLALAIGIKILPIFLLPFFLLQSRKKAAALAVGFGAALGLIFVPSIVIGGAPVVRNIFGYSAFAGKWGLPALLLVVEKAVATPRSTVLYVLAYLYATQGKFVILAAVALLAIRFRRIVRERPDTRREAVATISLVFLFVLSLAPGFGIQYLVWPLALLPFLLEWKEALLLNAVISAYVFTTYTIWSKGFPWWYANSIAAIPHKEWVIYLGFPTWWIIIWAAARGYGQIFRRTGEAAEPGVDVSGDVAAPLR
ncbi:MAG TPA: glycosyltransferase family 87 protein [Thermoanaerobaculia bacterium]|nr:glycosyltransferase family 87 protein [Thermoanaerobaculia bacterium]